MYKIFLAAFMALGPLSASGINFDEELRKAEKEQMFSPLLQERKSASDIPLRELQKIERERELIEQERNKALEGLIAICEDEELCRVIRRVASFKPTHSQSEALQYLGSLRYKPLNSSHSALENTLIAIDFEHQCKECLADSLFIQEKISKAEAAGMKRQFCLAKYQKMLEAAMHSGEYALGKKVEEAYDFLPEYTAYRKDLQSLIALGKETSEPANDFEAKIRNIMQKY